MLLAVNSRSGDRIRKNCIIDPTLALSQYGVTLVKHLGEVMDLWVVRELWNILDNPTLYLEHPDLITPQGPTLQKTPEQERLAFEETIESLREWETFRAETDLAQLHLFWLGDSPRESLLPAGRNLDIFWRWEAIAHSLDRQLPQLQTADYLLPLAFRDTVALALSIGSSMILAHFLPSEVSHQSAPEICNLMDHWGISCQSLATEDALVIEERNYLRQLLVETGAAKVIWAGACLSVVHLLAPILSECSTQSESSEIPALGGAELRYVSLRPLVNWRRARGFWYIV